MICEASLSALLALISPSAAMTFALASLLASASAAMARCNCSGNLASLLKHNNYTKGKYADLQKMEKFCKSLKSNKKGFSALC